jgi:hypothetical protein
MGSKSVRVPLAKPTVISLSIEHRLQTSLYQNTMAERELNRHGGEPKQ